MSQRSPILLLLLLVAIASCAGLFVLGWFRAPSSIPGSATLPPVDARPETNSPIALDVASGSERSGTAQGGESGQVAEPARASLALPQNDPELQGALWVEGRVVLPVGTPADEHVEILAKGTPFPSRPLYRAPIDQDGKFRVAFAPGTVAGYLALEGRYVYLGYEQFVSPAHPPQGLVLYPTLGGMLIGRLVLLGSAASIRDSLPGREVVIYGRVESSDVQSEGLFDRTAKLSDDLRFTVAGLRAGTVYRFYTGSLESFFSSYEPVRVEPGRVVAVDVEIRSGASVSGRVIDSNGQPVQGTTVFAESHVASVPSEWKHLTTSAPDGSFTLSGILPGRLKLTVMDNTVGSVDVDVGEISAGEVKTGIEFVVSRAQAVSGRVLWPDGRPASGCTLAYSFAQPTAGRTLHPVRIIQCDPDGEFRIKDLGATPVFLSAKAQRENELQGPDIRDPLAEYPKLQGSPSRIRSGAPWVARLEGVMPGTEGVVLTLRPGASIRCRVVDESGSRVPCNDVTANPVTEGRALRGGMASVGSSVNSEGEIEVGGLFDGEWDLIASAPGYANSAPVRISIPSSSARVDLVVLRTATVSGVVVDGRGEAAPWATVNVGVRESGDEDWRWSLSWRGSPVDGRADAEGRFTVSGVPPGPVIVVAEGKEGRSGIVKLELRSGEEESGVRLVLTPVDESGRGK